VIYQNATYRTPVKILLPVPVSLVDVHMFSLHVHTIVKTGLEIIGKTSLYCTAKMAMEAGKKAAAIYAVDKFVKVKIKVKFSVVIKF